MTGSVHSTPQHETAAQQGTQTIVITRVFDAPRELVWKAWTEPDRFMRWWGPKDFTSPRCEMDLRVGGRYLWSMRWPDGHDEFSTGEFRAIVPGERLVFTDNFADASGNVVSSAHYGMTTEFGESLVTVVLEDCENGTRMTLTHAGLPAGEIGGMANQGWNESFDKMEASLR